MKRMFLICLYVTLGCALFFFLLFTEDKTVPNFLLSCSIAAMYAFILGFGNSALNERLNRWYSWTKDTAKRTLSGIAGTVFLNVTGIYTISFINYCVLQKAITPQEYWHSVNVHISNIITILIAFLISALLHAYGFMKELKKASRQEITAQKFIASAANAQYESLRSQLDPHFLFNSLNVLASLIEEHPKKAEQFTESLSKVYRYVLDQKDKEVVTIAEELQFAAIYRELLQYRFEDSIRFSFHIPADALAQYIVPLSLQLLLENAIKHNYATGTHPLNIHIFTEGRYLNVVNNLQTRDIEDKRTGIGLSNIVQRYALLAKAPVFIEQSSENFTVKIPILKEKPLKMNTLQNNLPENSAYERAARQVKRLRDFYTGLISYVVVNTLLVAINLWTSPAYLWCLWPIIGWGIGLGSYALSNFVIGNKWEENKIKALMNRENRESL